MAPQPLLLLCGSKNRTFICKWVRALWGRHLGHYYYDEGIFISQYSLPMTNPSHVSRSEPSSMSEFVEQLEVSLKMSTSSQGTTEFSKLSKTAKIAASSIKTNERQLKLKVLLAQNEESLRLHQVSAIVRSMCRRWSTSPLKKNTSHLQIGGHIIHGDAAAIISKMVKGHAHFFPVITFRYARNISRAIVGKNARRPHQFTVSPLLA